MAAYLIADIDIIDAPAYEAYKQAVPALIAKHGGTYLVRGGDVTVIEGDWMPTRLVMFEFPDRASVDSFLNDPAYLPLKELRQRVATSSLVVVTGN